MVYLVNANLGTEIARTIEEFGHEVILVNETYPPGTADEHLVLDAQKNGWIIVTLDKGFSQYAYRFHPEGYGVITLRVSPQETFHICQRLRAVFETGINVMNQSIIVTNTDIRGLL
ncbi:MAG: hypothetical protein C7B44_16015 [Sulfobacillus thermosulfidooxidans]|nr:MAG: hypothetical protein C7B44_16015 [Sulfobacillus thermosulfidooxidans]